MTTHKIIGERIKNLRQHHNLTREEVAEKAEISSKFLYEIEKGTKGLSADTLLRIARTLSCSCDYILTGEDYEQSRENRIWNILDGFSAKDMTYVNKMLALLQEMREDTETE